MQEVQMNYLEIILKNIKSAQIEKVFNECVQFDEKDIKSSHFFDKVKNTDSSYQKIGSLSEYFNTTNSGNIYLQKAIVGTELKNVLILISSDEKCVDITINFEKEQFKKYDGSKVHQKLEKILTLLLMIQRENEVDDIVFGYEPADDVDMRILRIFENQIEIYDEEFFRFN